MDCLLDMIVTTEFDARTRRRRLFSLSAQVACLFRRHPRVPDCGLALNDQFTRPSSLGTRCDSSCKQASSLPSSSRAQQDIPKHFSIIGYPYSNSTRARDNQAVRFPSKVLVAGPSLGPTRTERGERRVLADGN
ncbi:hypothetical protein B0T18DRAFT_232739 [Schizothecium vesticola]|uniref:Uncharacterized protein n=1 Tax=Schizothecium vesticola TaxID=314040 RepID=A0AA40K0K8_9PEZI|nr:hypothetical protein B0T18DRAFT_232739 [Schizothecium vesticola]